MPTPWEKKQLGRLGEEKSGEEQPATERFRINFRRERRVCCLP